MINSVKSLGKMCGIIKDNEDEEEYWLEIHKINTIKMNFDFAFAMAFAVKYNIFIVKVTLISIFQIYVTLQSRRYDIWLYV